MCEIQNIPHLAAILGLDTFETIVSPLLESSNRNPQHTENQGYLPVNHMLLQL